MTLNALLAEANEAAEQLEDQTEAKGAAFEHEVPPAGPTPARFIGYVEVGKRKQKPWQGKEKPDAEEVRLYFELNGKKHIREVEVDGVKKRVTNIITVKVAKKLSENAAFFKLLGKMRYGRDSVKHMSAMLGEAFLVTVVHNKNTGADGKEVTYANLRDADGNWMIGAPMYQTDPLDADTLVPLPVPEVTQNPRLLLWDKPSKAQWDSLFIDGTREVKDAKGNVTTVSRNWLQEDIVQNATNFEGSALQALIGGLGALSLEPEAPTAGKAEKSPAKAPVEKSATTPAAKVEKAPAAPADEAGDPLAALGL
jgi:hypothetical protein